MEISLITTHLNVAHVEKDSS